MRDQLIPVRPVEDPILCSPWDEPDRHWLYDTRTGVPSKAPGRRPAGYWFRTERTGSAQRSLLAEEERDDLPLVNVLRADVGRWRKAGWPGASQTTKKLLRHWWRPDRARRLFFCQLEAAETVIYLRELLARGRTPRWKPQLGLRDFELLHAGRNPRPGEWVAKAAQPPRLSDAPPGAGGPPIPRYACKMATGSGKTVVMAMLVAWAFCNRGTTPGDPRFPRRALVVCPNLTIRDRLRVLRPADPGSYYAQFDVVPSALRPALAGGRVLVTNWHRLAPASDEVTVGGVAVGRLGDETPEAFVRNRLGGLGDGEPLLVLNDEGHHAYRPAPAGGESLSAEERADREAATVWVDGLDRIHAACGIDACVDLSATPFHIQGSGYPEGSPFPWIVSDFSLVDAIECGVTKIPRLPAADNTGRPDPKYFRLWEHVTKGLRAGERLTGGRPKPEAVYRKAEDALLTLAGEWRERFERVRASAPGQDRTPPVLIVVCDTTATATHVHGMISGEEAVESSDGSGAGAEDDAAEDGGAPRAKRGRSGAGVDADARLREDGGAPRAKRRGRPRTETRRGPGLPGFPELWNRDGEEVTLRIDSKLLEAAERGDAAATRKDAAEALRRVVATIGRPGEPGARIRCVVSVNMLSEGWDANNVTHILGLRAFRSQLLCEQVVGRGLRRMDYTPDPATGRLTAEYVDVFGVPFSLIPFKGREPGTGTPTEEGPKHEVTALPARRAFEIRFPVVEGYVAALRRNRVVCDVESMEWTELDPTTTPTAAFVQPQVGYKVGDPASYGGFGFREVDRRQYYNTVHPQTIAFRIAVEVVHQLLDSGGGGARPRRQRAALFPQVLRIVQEYVRKRVRFNGLHPCEIGLQTYAQRIAGLLAAAVRPDDARGEAPLLPRLNRYEPVGTTARVRFKTVRPVQATRASHLNFVACDTAGWEQAAAFQLERLAERGVVDCYARNDHLEFNIPYELYREPHAYEPDYIVRLKNGVHVVLEIKGRQYAGADAKHEAARRWVRAVNHWGRLGEWDFLVCRDPQALESDLSALIDARRTRIRETAVPVHEKARKTLTFRSFQWNGANSCRIGRVPSDGWRAASFAIRISAD